MGEQHHPGGAAGGFAGVAIFLRHRVFVDALDGAGGTEQIVQRAIGRGRRTGGVPQGRGGRIEESLIALLQLPGRDQLTGFGDDAEFGLHGLPADRRVLGEGRPGFLAGGGAGLLERERPVEAQSRFA